MNRKDKESFDRLTQKQLKTYARFFKEKGLEELVIEQDGLRLTLEGETTTKPSLRVEARASEVVQAESEATQEAKSSSTGGSRPSIDGHQILSPITGTFYASPGPGEKPFVAVGEAVKPDSVVCIVEAMKNMNEIRAGAGGNIADILVKDGEAVQSGQVLMVVS